MNESELRIGPENGESTNDLEVNKKSKLAALTAFRAAFHSFAWKETEGPSWEADEKGDIVMSVDSLTFFTASLRVSESGAAQMKISRHFPDGLDRIGSQGSVCINELIRFKARIETLEGFSGMTIVDAGGNIIELPGDRLKPKIVNVPEPEPLLEMSASKAKEIPENL